MIYSRVIGHRGAAAYAPENTLAAFQKAKELGCNFIEFDVSESKDGELFIFHDNLLSRTTNGQGSIDTSDSSYIKKLDAGMWFSKMYAGTKIPTFKETIFWLLENDMQANIEIKPTTGKVLEITKSIIDELQKYWPESKALPIVSSFSYEVLLLCKKIAPEIPLGYLLDKWPYDWLHKSKIINCKAINISTSIVSKKIVSEIKKNGFDVNVFTVNSSRLARKYYEWGVSAVFSDYPDLLNKSKFLKLKNIFL